MTECVPLQQFVIETKVVAFVIKLVCSVCSLSMLLFARSMTSSWSSSLEVTF